MNRCLIAMVTSGLSASGGAQAADITLLDASYDATHQLYRPRNPTVFAKYKSQFPPLSLATVDGDFGGWAKAQQIHLADGWVFDQIYQPGR